MGFWLMEDGKWLESIEDLLHANLWHTLSYLNSHGDNLVVNDITPIFQKHGSHQLGNVGKIYT